MKISSVICTCNRAEYLPHAIRSLAEQDMARDDYEIIIVDNGSTDSTREIVSGLMRDLTNLRYVYEHKSGLSHARNRGLEEAAAPIVAFLDDDAIAVPAWLSSIVNAFTTQPGPVCVGGPVEPWYEVSRPTWFPDVFIGCHQRHYGDVPRWCSYPAEQPVGCNMAFVKERVMQVGGFNGQLQKYNDETELISRLIDAGGQIFYEPRAGIRHLFGKERLRLTWQIKRHYEEGKSLACVAASRGSVPRTRRITEIGRNLLSIGKRSARLIVSTESIQDRVRRLADLSLLIGKTVYVTNSLWAK